eukprot:5500321-Ditylum_brightwellii.AAC.1
MGVDIVHCPNGVSSFQYRHLLIRPWGDGVPLLVVSQGQAVQEVPIIIHYISQCCGSNKQVDMVEMI